MKISDIYDLPMHQDNDCIMSNDCRYKIDFDVSDSNCDEQIEVLTNALNSHDKLKELLSRARDAISEAGYEDFDHGLMNEIDEAI